MWGRVWGVKGVLRHLQRGELLRQAVLREVVGLRAALPQPLEPQLILQLRHLQLKFARLVQSSLVRLQLDPVHRVSRVELGAPQRLLQFGDPRLRLEPRVPLHL